MHQRLIILLCLFIGTQAWAEKEFLVKVSPRYKQGFMFSMMSQGNTGIKDLGFNNWLSVKVKSTNVKSFQSMALNPPQGIVHIQPNFKLKMPSPMSQLSKAELTKLQNLAEQYPDFFAEKDIQDNPPIPAYDGYEIGEDPLLNHQWGMVDIGAIEAWRYNLGNPNVVVAVIDTGVDYTHEDLLPNMWRNPGETGPDARGHDKSTNGIDDDGNGYVDDVVGYDFAANDNLPFDLTVPPAQLIFGGGNPGHGTHCAGNVAARGDNGLGISGVAPNVKIMALRFLTENGSGTTQGAIQSILYAVNNGAHVLSNSWGSEGEGSNQQANLALKEAIQYAQDNGRLFIAAAGNGHQGVGYSNDTGARPAYPASYDHEIIISVAALDLNAELGSFSNWGATSVDIGAPGVNIYSTMPDQVYSNIVVDAYGMKITWDGTSMATPHVAGAAALYWSMNPDKNWLQVKNALLNSAIPISSMTGKSTSQGKLNVINLMYF